MKIYFIIKQYEPIHVRNAGGWFTKNFEIFDGFRLNHEKRYVPEFSRLSTKGFKASTEDILADASISGLMFFNLQHAQREARRFEKEINSGLQKDETAVTLEVATFDDLRMYYEESNAHFEKASREELNQRFG